MCRNLALLLYLIALSAVAQKAQPKMPLDLDAPNHPIHTDSHPCAESELKFLDEPATRILLADYGYEVAAPFQCVAAVVPWLPAARIIRLHESMGLDDYREVTITQGGPSARVEMLFRSKRQLPTTMRRGKAS
jgi:hypothetical protein